MSNRTVINAGCKPNFAKSVMKENWSERPFIREWVPEPVWPDEPALVDLYWKAWESAWRHVKGCAGVPQSPFMDEAFSPRTIWIWDTCFMAHFCKYAPDRFPGIESLDNFYRPMYGDQPSALRIHHPDNPPLFAWTEYEYRRFTGRTERNDRLLNGPEYLIRHYDFIEQAVPGVVPPYANCPLAAKRDPLGYRWSGTPSGMDNTPRGRDQHEGIYWLDLMAQQALNARIIADEAASAGDDERANDFRARYAELVERLNTHYWDDVDGCYYDIRTEPPHEKVRVKTPASFWPLLAGVADAGQAERMAALAADPQGFGGEIPWPSVTPDDPAFDPEGAYWRGAVWLPTAYMASKALAQYGHHDIASTLALRLIRHQQRTYETFDPPSIWECYSPTAPHPGTNPKGDLSRPDFCGWSALGSIAMLIEQVLGVQEVDAASRRIVWRPTQPGVHGLRRLRAGDLMVDLIAYAGHVEIQTNKPCVVTLNGAALNVPAGASRWPR
jgi:hypothetical protein